MRHFVNSLVVLLTFFACFQIALADQDTIVFGCNYTISMSIDGEDFEVSHQDRVRNGSATVRTTPPDEGFTLYQAVCPASSRGHYPPKLLTGSARPARYAGT